MASSTERPRFSQGAKPGAPSLDHWTGDPARIFEELEEAGIQVIQPPEKPQTPTAAASQQPRRLP